MGQHASVPASAVAPPTVSRQLENFFHVCNIIPDTPQHQKRQWTPAQIVNPNPNTNVQSNRSSDHHRRRRGSRREPVVSTTDYTTDDESDTYELMRRRHRSKRHHRLRQRNHHSSSNRYSDTDNSMDDDELLRTSTHSKRSSNSIAFEEHTSESANKLPLTLDRRFDLDIAPSMVNMNLQWNGAYMVASLIYNEIAVKYGYKHLLSVQQLHWEAVRRYYQLTHVDSKSHYKVSLGALLDIVQSVSLHSEREISVYSDLTAPVNSSMTDEQSLSADISSVSGRKAAKPTQTLVQLPCMKQTRPFYRMEYYSVPLVKDTLKRALIANHLVLCNLTLFSNFLSARQGIVPHPNQDDISVGMVAVTLVGYQSDQELWLVRFPFGLHWGDQGIGYVSNSYLEAYNRDRWIVDVVECGEPPEYQRQREAEQADGVPGRLPVQLGNKLDDRKQHPLPKPTVKNNIKQKEVNRIRLRMI